ncbi:Lrp/AsnC family transcriptional regulator [Hyphomonas jannaschiana]|uniref:Transcriptional regulator n=1 Tax=Hyphomonas jannaschiana VP2 TaxID=1280952 RepID=A0A059F6Y7_9PROT|nr:Lrp/AsnC family transcriptional regulator [Hyphomonas jannaschiana]KCZ83808.1 transcriptional regulator [Hyphomonas jannaschiana VP2]
MTTNIATITPVALDSFDRHILRIVQQDNQMTHAEIGAEVGLSLSAVRRRLNRLRQDGVIAKDVSLLSQDGLGVRLIVAVTFEREIPEAIDAFVADMRETPEVLQVYHVSGPLDYILVVQGPSLQWYEAWGKTVLMTNPNIRRYDTHVVWSCQKFETALPL